jgi:nitrogen fixation protein NifU and related proteins
MAMMRESLMDHFERPRNVGEIASPDGDARAGNPVCGDEVRVTLRLSGDRISEARFRAFGCHATLAATSLLTERVRGGTVVAAREVTPATLAGWFEDFPAGKMHAAEVAVEALGGALSGIEGSSGNKCVRCTESAAAPVQQGARKAQPYCFQPFVRLRSGAGEAGHGSGAGSSGSCDRPALECSSYSQTSPKS